MVVSVYKVKDYLDHCIQTLLNQTYQDYEILLVDDGSPDACGAMCDAWAEKEARISAYHKPNGGLSSARNFGIAHARGAFIIFPDPDDWVEPRYLEKLMSLRESTQADLSICGHSLFKEGKELLKRVEMSRSDHSWHILHNKELGLFLSDNANVVINKFTSFVFYTQTFSSQTPRLARRSTNNPITIWDVLWCNISNVRSV